MSYGIKFSSEQDDILVVGYVNSDYVGDMNDMRFTTWHVYTLGREPIYWKLSVQSI